MQMKLEENLTSKYFIQIWKFNSQHYRMLKTQNRRRFASLSPFRAFFYCKCILIVKPLQYKN